MINLTQFLKKYFVVYTTSVLVMVFFLQMHKQRSFSERKLAEILLTASKFKSQTDDPCLFSIVGEPETPGQYLKLTFKCPNREARFTLDFMAIREKTVGGAITELFRLNGVTLGLARLRCSQGGRAVAMKDVIVRQDNIECNL